MALSGGSGGGSTNLTGLSPEQINAISGTDIAGQKVANDSVQNIFENATKMAYSDYLDANRKLLKDQFRTPLVSNDTYWDFNPTTRQWYDTGVEAPVTKIGFRPESGPKMPYKDVDVYINGKLTKVLLDQHNGVFIDPITKKDITHLVKSGPGGGLTGARPDLEQGKQDVKVAEKVANTIAVIEGKAFDNKGKPIPYSQGDIDFVNKHGRGSVYYFEKVTPVESGIGSFKWAGEPKKEITTWPKSRVEEILKAAQADDPTVTLEDILYTISQDLGGAK